MSLLRGFGGFIYEFIVGDDPFLAGAAVLALGLTAALAAGGAEAWWVTPVVALAMLSISVLRGARPDPSESDGPGPPVG
jgi:hypothetical protein